MEKEYLRVREALEFCLDIATEAYQELDKSVSMEVALRHIMRKANEGLRLGADGQSDANR